MILLAGWRAPLLTPHLLHALERANLVGLLGAILNWDLFCPGANCRASHEGEGRLVSCSPAATVRRALLSCSMSSTPRRKRVLSVSTATRTPPRLSGEHDAAPAALEDVFMPAVSSSPRQWLSAHRDLATSADISSTEARRTVFDDGCSRSSKIESAASSFAFPAGSAIVSPRRSRANTINRQHQPAAARQSRYFGSALGHDQPGAERQAVRSAYVVRSVRPPLPSLGRNHAATRAPRSSLDQASASPLKRQWRDVAATIFLVSAALLLTLWHVLRGRAVETLSEVAAVGEQSRSFHGTKS